MTLLLVSSTLVDAPLIRTTIAPTPGNGLKKPSQVMVDKAISVKRDRIGATIGHAEGDTGAGSAFRHRLNAVNGVAPSRG